MARPFLVASLGFLVIALLLGTAAAEHGVFPQPGDETWEIISDTGVNRHCYSDRCCALDGRNRLCVCSTGFDSMETLRRWDGVVWEHIDVPDDIFGICSGPDNVVLFGHDLGLGHIRDDEYHKVGSYDAQCTMSFEGGDYVLSSNISFGLWRTNWREGGCAKLETPCALLYEIDTWGPDHRWCRDVGDRMFYQSGQGEWTDLSELIGRGKSLGVWQIEPHAPDMAWAASSSDLYHHVGDELHSLVESGCPMPNGQLRRIALDRNLGVWCYLDNDQIARWDGTEWTHYTCEVLAGQIQDMVFDHFENLYLITNETIVKMCNNWLGTELDIQCTKQTYLPGETVAVGAIARNATWTGMLLDLYIAYLNKVTGELIFLPDLSSEVKPLIAGLWAKKRAAVFIGTTDIGPAPSMPGDYTMFAAFMFEGRFDILSSNLASCELTVVDAP